MRFQSNRAPVCGLLLSLCSLHVYADDSNFQGPSIGTAIGSLLGGYIHQAITPTNTSTETSASSDTTAAPVQDQSIRTTPMSAENQAYMAKGLWHDPSTSLIWNLCRVGETWNGSGCDGKPTQLDWLHAMLAARDSRLDGHDDWRVPSFSEYAGIIRCPTGFDESDYGQSYETKLRDAGNDINGTVIKACRPIREHDREAYLHVLPEHFSFKSPLDSRYYDVNRTEFSEWTSTYTLDMSKRNFFPVITKGNGGTPETSSPNITTRLVRGGTSTSSYQQALQTASAYLKIPMLRAKAAQAKQDDLARRTTLLRKNVSEGDKTAQGLVIEVKGNLVKLQTYNKVCVAMNQFTNPPICTRYQAMPGSEAWVNRNDLTPIQ